MSVSKEEKHPSEVTRLLVEWGQGNELAFEELVPLVYDELRRMAGRYMRSQDGHTFQTTDLIHEAYLKLAGNNDRGFENRAHFFGVAAKAMRHILVDHAKAKSRQKRGQSPVKVTLNEDAAIVSVERSADIVKLDVALTELQKLDDRKSRVVELKFFGGMNIDEIARVLKISANTVKRDWRFARSWLLTQMSSA